MEAKLRLIIFNFVNENGYSEQLGSDIRPDAVSLHIEHTSEQSGRLVRNLVNSSFGRPYALSTSAYSPFRSQGPRPLEGSAYDLL